MSRTPLIRRLIAIAVAAAIPLAATAPSAHADTWPVQSSPTVTAPSAFSGGVGFTPVESFRSSWS